MGAGFYALDNTDSALAARRDQGFRVVGLPRPRIHMGFLPEFGEPLKHFLTLLALQYVQWFCLMLCGAVLVYHYYLPAVMFGLAAVAVSHFRDQAYLEVKADESERV